MNGTRPIAWQPQAGPQKALIDCPFPEIFFGGARGGGKTDGVLGKFAIKAGLYGKHFNAVFFRKEMPQQDDLIERAKDIYCKVGAQWHDYKKLFTFPGGGRVRFRPLENDQDAEKYQGQNLTDAAVEEVGNYPFSSPIDKLFGCLRGPIPVQLILTANPGGVGQNWIKMRYIDPAPKGMQVLTRDLPNGAKHNYVYIPSRVQDNKVLLHTDPSYINRLYLVGSPELVRAWLEGDWNVVSGAFFPEFGLRHIIRPFEIPQHWTRIRAGDWGSARPFSIGWYAIADGTTALPKGAAVKYREWYGMAEGQPNVGLNLTAEELADGIIKRETYDGVREPMNDCVLDPSAWIASGGPSLAERMLRAGVYWRQADNARLGKLGALGGWDQLRARLKGNGDGPLIYFLSTCTHTIRTIPSLQHDKTRAEDVDSDGEDHAGDETRYFCMSRPIVRYDEKRASAKFPIHQTFDELVKSQGRKRLED